MVRYLVTMCGGAGAEKYGIAAVDDQGIVDSVSDVAATWQETAFLTAYLQENGVAAVHFRDVIEDWLAR